MTKLTIILLRVWLYLIIYTTFATAGFFNSDSNSVSKHNTINKDDISKQSDTLQIYIEKGGCYREVMETVKSDCDYIVVNEDIRYQYGIKLMMCDAKKRKLRIPHSCTAGLYSLCIEQLQDYKLLTELHAQHISNIYTGCNIEMHFTFINDRQKVTENLVTTVQHYTVEAMKHSKETLDNSKQALELQTLLVHNTLQMGELIEEYQRKQEEIEENVFYLGIDIKTISSTVKDQRADVSYFANEVHRLLEFIHINLKTTLDSIFTIVNFWDTLQNEYQSTKQWLFSWVLTVFAILIFGFIIILCIYFLPWRWIISISIISFAIFQMRYYWIIIIFSVLVWILTIQSLSKWGTKKDLFSHNKIALHRLQKMNNVNIKL